MVLALARAHGGFRERRRGASRGRPGRKFTGLPSRKKKKGRPSSFDKARSFKKKGSTPLPSRGSEDYQAKLIGLRGRGGL